MLTNIFQTKAMVSQYFNRDRKPNPGGFQLLPPPPKDSCLRPHKLIPLLGNRQQIMLGWAAHARQWEGGRGMTGPQQAFKGEPPHLN